MVSRTEQILRREKMEITLSTLIDLFAATKQIEGNSPRTIVWYVRTLSRFVNSVGTDQPAKLGDIDIHDARAFVASLQEAKVRYADHPLRKPEEGKLAAITVHGYVRAIKTFGAWLREEGYTGSNIFEKLKRPKVPKPVIEILSDQEIDRLFSSINPNSFLGSRLYVIVLLLLDTGIRASELCTLTVENTFVDDGYVKVHGKGGKDRIVPFGTTTRKALIRYIATFRPEPLDPDDSHLILSSSCAELTYYGLFHTIKRLGKKVEVPRLHPHLFRHTFAVRYLMNGGDVMTLKLMLGHTTLDVTQIYMHLAEAHVQIQHHKFSPVDRLGLARRRNKP